VPAPRCRPKRLRLPSRTPASASRAGRHD
jgi:hypothetical protein